MQDVKMAEDNKDTPKISKAATSTAAITNEAGGTPLLDQVNVPEDMRDLSAEELVQLSDEVRQEMIRAVSRTGGHLGAGLGVVELTVALHHVFNTPEDRLIWDVGHQAYPHKILTNRRDRIRTLRQEGGLSGFTKRDESEYDPFGTAHAATSISAGLGMSVARDLSRARDEGPDRNVICVIGDGSMSAGMAYEAMNNAGAMDSRLIVILNDNDMAIAPPVGAMSAYLSRLLSSQSYQSLRRVALKVARKFPKGFEAVARRVEEHARGVITGGTLFEEMGFFYIGPVDGHNIEHMLPILRNIRDARQDGPVLIHVVTQKGKGYAPAEESADKYHGVSKFDIVTGAQDKPEPKAPSYTSIFAKALMQEAAADEKIVAISAAMPSGTGLDKFGDAYPDRTFDVGIAEQHGVTFAAGMATEGYKPFAVIYSTFLQRAYDSVVHDVALQKLPVRFALDRAGMVGADGATHQGAYDIAYLGCLPGMVLMAASDEAELMHMVATAAAIDDRPSVLRYPRGEGTGVELPARGKILEIGKGRIVTEGSAVALIAYGASLTPCLQAAAKLEARGLTTTVVDARFAKPLDEDLINRMAREHEVLISVEEGSIGGFASQVMTCLSNAGHFDKGLKFRPMTIPDIFIDHASPARQLEIAGLTGSQIAQKALCVLGREREAVELLKA